MSSPIKARENYQAALAELDKYDNSENLTIRREMDKVKQQNEELLECRDQKNAIDSENLDRLLQGVIALEDKSSAIQENIDRIAAQTAQLSDTPRPAAVPLTYAGAVARIPTSSGHSLTVSSTLKSDTSENVLNKIRTSVNPTKTGVRVDGIRRVRNQRVVITCGSREEVDAVTSRLKGNSELSFQEVKALIASGTMRTTQISQYALRLTYSQPANRDKMMSRSALVLAALGIGLSTFSVRQMILNQTRRI
ncbi:unnamed protein product [Leptidea sinapis]|uniref:Uncharacterized protein n=1 Tax=Leptidea sinapis TaxID=189913 RepID=A0A5E4PQB8_9NEOP|nr:unnamed protein product [Leptidea sinapis]